MDIIAGKEKEIEATIIELQETLNLLRKGCLSPGLYSIYHNCSNSASRKLGILTVSTCNEADISYLDGRIARYGKANVDKEWLRLCDLVLIGKLEQIDLDPEKEHHGGL